MRSVKKKSEERGCGSADELAMTVGRRPLHLCQKRPQHLGLTLPIKTPRWDSTGRQGKKAGVRAGGVGGRVLVTRRDGAHNLHSHQQLHKRVCLYPLIQESAH